MGEGGVLYIYPNKSSLGHYIVFSFFNITVKEPWVSNPYPQIDLILDFEPVTLVAADPETRDTWLKSFRELEKSQYLLANSTTLIGSPRAQPTRITHEDLQAADFAVHHGEHLHLQSPHKEIRDLGSDKLANGDTIREESMSSTINTVAKAVDVTVASPHPSPVPVPADSSPMAASSLCPPPPGECIILNNRKKWNTSENPARDPLVVIGDLIHTIQSIYGVTKEGQRLDSEDSDEDDEWHIVADSQMFDHFASATAELQVVNIKGLEPHEKSKFFISTYSLLSMHAAGVLKISLDEVMEQQYTASVAYIINNRVYSLAEVMELCS